MHRLHTWALPTKILFIQTNPVAIYLKSINYEQPRNEWIDLHFQIINNDRQKLLETLTNSVFQG
jgi:hypothetical protein